MLLQKQPARLLKKHLVPPPRSLPLVFCAYDAYSLPPPGSLPPAFCAFAAAATCAAVAAASGDPDLDPEPQLSVPLLLQRHARLLKQQSLNPTTVPTASFMFGCCGSSTLRSVWQRPLHNAGGASCVVEELACGAPSRGSSSETAGESPGTPLDGPISIPTLPNLNSLRKRWPRREHCGRFSSP